MAVLPAPHRLTVEEYHRMAEVGLLQPDDRTELLDGEIIDMAPIGSRHAACVTTFNDAFHDRLKGRAVIWVQNPVRLDDDSEPQPDLALLRVRSDRYADSLPEAADVLLLVEVADTTVRFDRLRKMPLYAQAGIVEVWLVDVEARTIECYREPVDGSYRQVHHLAAGDTIAATFSRDTTYEVTDFIH